MENTLKKTGGQTFMEYVYEIHNSMVKNNIMLIYEGEVNQDITKAFTSLTQRNLEESETTNVPLKKRVYHVMVECLQNICKHSDNIQSGEPEVPGTGLFIVSKSEEGFSVITGNPVSNSRIEEISTILNKVNSLNEEEIKVYYKQKMLESRISEKGGAGLGFIDIVKKTGNKIEFHFAKINNLTSFFIVKTLIS